MCRAGPLSELRGSASLDPSLKRAIRPGICVGNAHSWIPDGWSIGHEVGPCISSRQGSFPEFMVSGAWFKARSLARSWRRITAIRLSISCWTVLDAKWTGPSSFTPRGFRRSAALERFPEFLTTQFCLFTRCATCTFTGGARGYLFDKDNPL